MKQNKYDDPLFFSSYQKMSRSVKGLEAAGIADMLVSIKSLLKWRISLARFCRK